MPAEDYTVIKPLGEGGFGTVNKVRHKNGKILAMKQGKGTGNGRAEITEIEVLLSLKNHSHIVHMVEYFLDKTNTHVCIVMEFCNGGNLEQYVIEKKPKHHVISVFMEQTADAVKYLHMNGIIHRDLKPENVLLVIQNGRASVKVADFGIAKIADPILPGQTLVNYMQTQIGTLLYLAPEVFDGHFTEKADVFSLGVIYCAILERLLQGKRLVIYYDNETHIAIGAVLHADKRAIRKLSPDVQIDTEICNLINKMIDPLYKSRPTAADVHGTIMQNLHNRPARQMTTSKQTATRSEQDIEDTACCQCTTWTCCHKALCVVFYFFFFACYTCGCCSSSCDFESRKEIHEKLRPCGRKIVCIISLIVWIAIGVCIIYLVYSR